MKILRCSFCKIFWNLSYENFLVWFSETVALSFLFDKHCSIMEELGLKDSSRDLQVNFAASFYFHLYLVPHICAARFDVTGNLEKFLVFGTN